MPKWICTTCGTQYPEQGLPPASCPICEDERQYVGYRGQQWITLDDLRRNGYRNAFYAHEHDLIGIGTTPEFAIGQRALLIRTPQGNVLWDCISLIDQATVDIIRGLGGIQAIAISHPHYYSSMVDWAESFDAPIYLHDADRTWVMRPSTRIRFWSGDTLAISDEIQLVRLGGHFAGGTVLHWQRGADNKGVLLTGDIIQVVADRRWVSFMYSYPNLIPLPAETVQTIRDRVSRLEFDRIYGAWFDRVIPEGAKEAVMRSADRYLRALDGAQQQRH